MTGPPRPDLANIPAGQAIGDIHLENFGIMGRNRAALHLGLHGRRDGLQKDQENRKQRWFCKNVGTAAEFVAGKFAE